MKRRVLKVILCICGIFCILYPLYSKFLAYKNQTEVINNYKEEMQNIDKAILEQKKKISEEFNKENSTETTIVDANSLNNSTGTSSYSFLKLGEMLGYIRIPKINVELPIYEGVNNDNLSKGVAHMENTSLPNGDLKTHAVLAGHTGLYNAEIFDNLNELKIGDEFYITYFGEESKYEVIEKEIVYPDETSGIKNEEGRCLVTLVTCTPKTINTHRLLVTAKKVEQEVDEKVENRSDEESTISSDDENSLEEIKKTELELFIEFVKKNISTYIYILIFFVILILISIFPKVRNILKKKG